jgi:hypothetical protein
MVVRQAGAVDVRRLQEGHILDIGMEMQQFNEHSPGLTDRLASHGDLAKVPLPASILAQVPRRSEWDVKRLDTLHMRPLSQRTLYSGSAVRTA